ncbi:hypothetical protein BYT27DRAFT_7180277 [Phlegmacium glaucopus]|nr:hypothetical protein BYT27DRAFT_7180277 [Phlegmacium glaucopus]
MSVRLFDNNGSRDIVAIEAIEQRENGKRPDPEKPSSLSKLAKIAIAITIFSAASYGEGWVNYIALAALFLVYLVAIG